MGVPELLEAPHGEPPRQRASAVQPADAPIELADRRRRRTGVPHPRARRRPRHPGRRSRRTSSSASIARTAIAGGSAAPAWRSAARSSLRHRGEIRARECARHRHDDGAVTLPLRARRAADMIRVAVVVVGLALAGVPDVLAATALSLPRPRCALAWLTNADLAAAVRRRSPPRTAASDAKQASSPQTPSSTRARTAIPFPWARRTSDARASLGQELQIGGQRGLIAAARADPPARRAGARRPRTPRRRRVRRAFAGPRCRRPAPSRVLALDAAAQAERLAGIAATARRAGRCRRRSALDLRAARRRQMWRGEAATADTEDRESDRPPRDVCHRR